MRPAAGDDVILLRLDRGMEEEARTMIDPLGGFVLNVRDPEQLHLVRVVHQSVTYDRRASVGDTLSVEVFDAVSKAEGVTVIAEIIRVGTKGNSLHVSDMYDIRNGSNPPMTQAGEHTFGVYLPAKATIDSVMAAGPGRIGVLISAASVIGEPGHYTVSFPLRPGETKFAFNYDVPYDGTAPFHHKVVHPVQQLAIMLPPTMTFRSISSGFHLLATSDVDSRVQAINDVKAGDVHDFEISGTGPLPSLASRTQAPQSRSPAVSRFFVPAPMRSNSYDLRKGDPGSQRVQSSAQELLWALMIGFIVVVCGFATWRMRLQRRVASSALRDTLREE